MVAASVAAHLIVCSIATGFRDDGLLDDAVGNVALVVAGGHGTSTWTATNNAKLFPFAEFEVPSTLLRSFLLR
jgi:hypothetical protein